MSTFDGHGDAHHEAPSSEEPLNAVNPAERQIPDSAGLPPEASQEDDGQFLPIGRYATRPAEALPTGSPPPIPRGIVMPPPPENEGVPSNGTRDVHTIAPGETTGGTHELTNAPELIREATEEIIETLQSSGGVAFRGGAIRNLACAQIHIVGAEAAHAFADKQLTDLELKPDEAIGVWVDMFAEGDAAALPAARRAVALASEELSLLEGDGLSAPGELTAQRLALLVAYGDTESQDFARRYTSQTPEDVQVDLFSKLYCAGDNASLSPALDAISKTKLTNLSGYELSLNKNIYTMANAAIERGRIDDALVLVHQLDWPDAVADIHAKLYAAGNADSLLPALDHAAACGQDFPAFRCVQRTLAEAGFTPAAKAIKRRIDEAEVTGSKEKDTDTAADLVTLHACGDPSAAEMLETLARSSGQPEIYASQLVVVGKENDALAMLQERRDRLKAQGDDTLAVDVAMLKLQHDDDQWRRVLAGLLASRRADALRSAAAHVRELAKNYQESQNNVT